MERYSHPYLSCHQFLSVFHLFCIYTAVIKKWLFLVTFPSLIESDTEAKLCASLLKPKGSVTMTISLVDEKSTEIQLVQQTSGRKFHRCFHFQAPQVSGDSVQTVRVVIQGQSFKMTEESKVMFRSYLPLTFIQTDKPLYNPGQRVNFRVLTMSDTFVPQDQMYSLVVVEDNNKIRIRQWTDISSTNWILELSHVLDKEAQVGTYTLKAYIGDRTISQSFDVKKYVLPKFDMTLNTPQTYNVADVGLKVEACAKYTYGQPVPGQVSVNLCRQHFTFIQDPKVTICLNETALMDDTGCTSLTFSTSTFFGTSLESSLQNSFVVNVNITEQGTDVVMSKSATVSITYEVGKVTFVDLPKFYDYGSTINAKISVSDFNGNAISNKVVYLLDRGQWRPKVLFNVTTDESGLAEFSLNTTNFPKANLYLVASVIPQLWFNDNSPHFTTDSQVVQLSQTAAPDNPTYSDLSIVSLQQPLKCGTTYPVTVKYTFVGETGDYSADIIYMVMSRGVIVLHGFKTVQAWASDTLTTGTVTFDLPVHAKMAPMVQILVFSVLPSETVVTGSASFDTEKCFSNQVSLQFSPATAVPGEGSILTVSAQAGSLCGLSAIDQSVLIMQSGGRLSAEAMFNLLPVRSLSDYPPGVEDQQNCLNVRPLRDVPTDQAYNTFKGVGIKTATNLPVREPPCLTYRGLSYYRNFPGVLYSPVESSDLVLNAPVPVELGELVRGDSGSPAVTIRTYFPETWIWQLVTVGDSGSTSVPLTVPDTITAWDTEAFCLASSGFGLAPPVLLTSFQPFFLEITLPYSIIRGEILNLKATVFNYLPQCIKVQVTPTPSSNFTLKSIGHYSSHLSANGRKTFKWDLTASVIGTINVTISAQASPSEQLCDNQLVTVPSRGHTDIVTRSLLVLAEGVERTFIRNWLLCPKGSILSENVKITFPTKVIQGSARCSVSAIGDIMGRALKNLANLLQMPYGCGEQNMIILAPNIYTLQYLKVTAQLTPAIQDTATSYLLSGYQRELNYRHSDGSFSTFPYSPSNTWLTTFVMRTFGLARNFTYIDPNVLQSAKDWLIGTQGSDGCFVQQGTLYHKDMKGGVDDNVTMTGYIVASMLEIGVPVTDPVITKALSFLRPLVGNLGNTYVTALLAYTFSLAGETSTRAQLLNSLRNTAISEGTTLHWSQTTSGDTLAVEISAYVLLAVLTVQPVTTANLGYANRIVNWLVAQQNPYGGFSSTQDTVVALQALSMYAAQVFSSGGSSTVTVQSSVPAGDVFNFDVTPNNRLLYQESPLNNFPGTYSVVAAGAACASVQVLCFYNIPTPVRVSKTLSVVAKVSGNCQATPVNLMLTFTAKYTGPKPTTNMVLVDIKLLSGFTADTSLLGSPPNFAPLVQRVDSEGDHVLIYLQEVPKGVPVTFSIQLTQTVAVQNLKPAVINIYDYYQRSDSFETAYKSPCP